VRRSSRDFRAFNATTVFTLGVSVEHRSLGEMSSNRLDVASICELDVSSGSLVKNRVWRLESDPHKEKWE
jgi:hypothetical protein